MGNDFPKMELKLGQVTGRENFTFEESFELPEHESGSLKCDSRVNAVVTSMGSRYLLEADVECEFHGKCGRCLEDCVSEVSIYIEVIFQRGENVNVDHQDQGESDFVLLSSEDEYCYDIFPRVKESVMLGIPMRILCSEDCKGLCPVCGANLNVEECGCEREKIDTRWAPLKGLLNDKSK